MVSVLPTGMEMTLSTATTALSPAVKQLICCIGMCTREVCEKKPKENFTADRTFLTPDGKMKLDDISSELPLPESDNTAEYFKEAVAVLAPVFKQCQESLICFSRNENQFHFLQRLKWTHSEKVFCDCLDMLRKQKTLSAKYVLVLLLVSASLERALGNVYLLKGTQCPSLLKDLLVTEELREILGSCLTSLLRIVMGPPVSLNLRNVAWHGFLGDEELPLRYCCFLVLLSANIGDVLAEKGISNIYKKPYFTWTPFTRIGLMSHSQCAVSETFLQSLRKLLEECSLIQPQTEGQWGLVFSLYSQSSYGYCLTLLLVLLEHCMRRVFATVNTCPERLLTAESSTLYTTFTEMLAQTLNDGSRNKLPEFLTTPCMDLLQDLLFYPEGPRVRDRLSHGEIDFASVDQNVVYPFLCIVVFIAYQLNTRSSFFIDQHFKEMVEKVKSYHSLFHPVAIMQNKYIHLLEQLEKMESCVSISADLELLQDNCEDFKLCDDSALWLKTQSRISSLWQHKEWLQAIFFTEDHHIPQGYKTQLQDLRKICQVHIPTLYRWQFLEGDLERAGAMKESEFVGLLLRIIEESTTATEQIQQSLQQRQLQLQAKVLHSRQRQNLKKLLNCNRLIDCLSVPCLQSLLTVVAVMLSWNIQRLQDYTSISIDRIKLMRKHLKVILQSCENLRTFTSSDKNKWTESVELLISLIPKCQQFFVHLSKPTT